MGEKMKTTNPFTNEEAEIYKYKIRFKDNTEEILYGFLYQGKFIEISYDMDVLIIERVIEREDYLEVIYLGNVIFENPNEEERLYTKNVEQLILRQHNVELVSRARRVKILNKPELETDVILRVRTPNKELMRTIGIELKQTDLPKALRQAIKRRKYFNWFYIIIALSPKGFVEWIVRDTNLYFALKKWDIGIVLAGNDEMLILPSKFYNTFGLINWLGEMK